MNVEQILSYVRQKGVVLIADGDRIKYKAPSGIMTPELAETIKTHRQEILDILTQDRESESTLHHLTQNHVIIRIFYQAIATHALQLDTGTSWDPANGAFIRHIFWVGQVGQHHAKQHSMIVR